MADDELNEFLEKSVYIRMTTRMWVDLKKVARKEDRTLMQTMRRALRAYLKDNL